jgi:hypothetical protein
MLCPEGKRLAKQLTEAMALLSRADSMLTNRFVPFTTRVDYRNRATATLGDVRMAVKEHNAACKSCDQD